MRFCLLLLCFCLSGSVWAQDSQKDSLSQSLFPLQISRGFLKHVHMNIAMRMGFRDYYLNGGAHDLHGIRFVNGYTALQFHGQLTKRIRFRFRNRFNKATKLQSLDELANNIELAYINIKANSKLNIKLGKMNAYFGGYEYTLSTPEVLVYNDIHRNTLAYVTGVALDYQVSKKDQFRLQVLNSRTMLFQDLYGSHTAANIEEPDWALEFVTSWRGSFLNGKLNTIYSFSASQQVKGKGTYFFTLGHQYHSGKFTLMYDFDYSYEQIDTKGVATSIVKGSYAAQNVTYIENWLRAEYAITPKFKGLLTFMTSGSYGKNLQSPDSGLDHLRTSYGVIPTFYYAPFQKSKVHFFLAYIFRYYHYSNFAIKTYGASGYNRNEIRIGFIAPLQIF